MPIKPENRHRYPPNWPEIRERIRARSGNRCEWCGVPNWSIGYRGPDGEWVPMPRSLREAGFKRGDVVACHDGTTLKIIRIVLTVAHVHDHNLAHLCQKCHNQHDAAMRQRNAASTRREWNLLSHVCTIAQREWHWLTRHPMKEVSRPSPPPPRTRRISLQEIEAISLALGYVPGADLATVTARVGAAWVFAIETAMRCGEICGLTWDRVFSLHVHLPMTKNGNPRGVPLSEAAAAILARLPRDGPLVFGLKESQVDALFRKAVKRAMVEDLHFHDSRREATSRMARKLDVMELARVTGHKDLRILHQVYYQPKVEDLAAKLRA